MNSQESSAPPSSPFTLRWRLFGIRFSIAPSFWIMSALMGWIILQMGPMPGNYWLNLGMWVLCTLVSVLVHELGHVLMGRLFGQPGNITLAGLGGQAAGKYEYLTPRERILVAAAGPCAGFLFLGLQVLTDETQWNWLLGDLPWDLSVHWSLLRWSGAMWRYDRHFQNVMMFLLIMNLFWNLLNLLPIFPMDGGMILREVCTLISPVGGPKFAYGFSFLMAASVALYSLFKVALMHNWINTAILRELPTIIHPYFGVVMFGMLAYQNFFFLRDATMAQRRAHYQDRGDD